MQKNKVAAVIDIGSSIVRMHISQWDGHEVATLDRLEKPTKIGKEVFSTGHISFDTVCDLSATLAGFCEKAREYGITNVYALATTALREASNQAYVLDHLATRNKLEVHVLEDTESGALLIAAMKNAEYIPSEKTLLVHGGTGATDFALLKNEDTVFSHTIQTGLLKIAEMLREASDFSHHIEHMAEEYLRAFFTRENRMQDLWKVDGLVFGTGDLQPLYRLFDAQGDIGGVIKLQSKMILKIYESYRTLSIGQICERHDLSSQQGGILYAMLTLLAELVRITKVKKLFCTQISLADAMLSLLLLPGARRSHNENLWTGAVSSASDLAARYGCDSKHCNHVAETALYLFEGLKDVHGMSKRHRLLLHIAGILHESGQYAGAADLQEASFDIVKNTQIGGFRSRETLLAANIIAPQSLLGVTRGARHTGVLCSEDVLFAAKMHALLHLADALDYSRKQKAKLCGVVLEGNHLTISVKTSEDFTLERWRFNQSAVLFKEIFGIVPKLNINHAFGLEGN